MTLPLTVEFGDIDIYLFDQLLRGRIRQGARVLDAGCGGGRNLVYLLRQGYDVIGADADPAAVDHVRRLAASLAPALPATSFVVAPVERMPFPDNAADVVLSSAVLHFARDDAQFDAMVREMWRVLKPGGIFFARLASTIGIENEIEHLEGRRYRLPDGSTRFLVDEQMLIETTEALGGEWLEPFKTVVVQHMRSMSNWVVRKK